MDDGRVEYDDFEAADTAIIPAGAVRRVRVLLGLVPLAEMTAAELAAVFQDRIDTAG